MFVCHDRVWTRYNPGPNALPVVASAARFSAIVNGHDLQISGAKIGAQVSLFDMQGRVMYNGRVETADFTLNLVRSGSFLLRVGSQQKVVNVR